VPNSSSESGPRRPLHLGYTYSPNGTHPAGWRYPGAQRARAHDPDYLVQLAQIAEGAAFDFFFFGDRLETGAEYELTDTSAITSLEPFPAAA